MSEKIEPALTSREWEVVRQSHPRHGVRVVHSGDGWNDVERVSDGHGEFPNVYYIRNDRSHALAARALYGQPFGFTWEDVRALRRLLDLWLPYLGGSAMDTDAIAVASISDRIAALLPPEESS